MRIRLAGAALVAATIAGCGGSAPSRPARTVALWSRRSGQRYRLVVKRPGARAHDAPVAPAGFPFDVNLGTDGRGRATAVYSRCAVGAPERGYPYEDREDCRLFAFDVATGAERPLAELHARGRSEVRAAIHGGVIVFARVRELHEADARATILVARLGSARPPRRLRSLALTGEDSVLGMDIDGSGVAVAVAVDLPTEPGFTALYLARPGGRCGRSRPGAAARRTAS